MDKNEYRVLIKHCFLIGKNTVEAKDLLQRHYGESGPSYSTIKNWFAEFRRGRTSTNDAERSGRPKEAIIPEIIKQVRLLVMSDRRLKVREIAQIVGISYRSVFTILHDHLHMKKLNIKWVPHFLDIDAKQKRVTNSEQCLAIFDHNPKEFLRRYITMDETWIHHFTPESNRTSAEWVEAGEERKKRVKQSQWAGKVLASVFWDAQGVIMIDYLEKGKTINKEYYMALLDRLDDEVKKKRPHLAKKKIIFHQDNAPSHKAKDTMAKIEKLGWELLPHPPYSPDLAPSDYWLFSNLKKWLAGKKFHTNEEVQWETDAYFEGLEKTHFSKGIEMLKERWTKCVEVDGDYIE